MTIIGVLYYSGIALILLIVLLLILAVVFARLDKPKISRVFFILFFALITIFIASFFALLFY